MKQWRWIWAMMHGQRWMLVLSCLLGCLRIAASLGFVMVSKALIDKATQSPRADMSTLVWYAVGLASLMLIELVFSVSGSYVSNKNEIRLKNKMRSQLYEHVLVTDFASTRRRHSGDTISRLIEDTRLIADAACQNLPELAVMAAMIISAFGFLYSMTPTLALCIVGIMPICIILSKLYMRRMRKITAKIRDLDSNVQSSMQEGVQHLVLVKAMSCARYMCIKLNTLQLSLFEATMDRTRFNLFSRTMLRLGFMAGYLTAFVWSVWHLYYGVITFGTMTAFLQLVARIQNPMANLARYFPSLVQATTSVDRLNELENEQAEPATNDHYLTGNVGITIDSIDFKYDDSDTYIFKDFSHDFKPGSVTAIVGVTGIGKTTLIRMMLALLYPQRGTISIYDNTQNLQVSPDTRCNIAYVPQGNSLICDTVRNNLLVANQGATDDEIRQALYIASADFVYTLPDGLDTVCGERGARLSEGQAQRIAIARALLRKGRLMLLDEFNSSLDANTALVIMQRIKEARPDHTIIMITHRTDIITHCSDILRL